jgi:hypothetical protein
LSLVILYKDSQAELFLQPIEGLQPYGTEKNAKMIVTTADGTVLRPDGEDSLMFRTDHWTSASRSGCRCV